MKKLNDIVGDKLAYWLSTMAMFYGISFLVIAPLFFATPTGLVAWLQYIVSVFFQGVALPVLGYVSRKGGEKQEKLLNETHDATMQEVTQLKEIIESLKELSKEQHDDATEQRKQLQQMIENFKK